jgi:hypothetical protein
MLFYSDEFWPITTEFLKGVAVFFQLFPFQTNFSNMQRQEYTICGTPRRELSQNFRLDYLD